MTKGRPIEELEAFEAKEAIDLGAQVAALFADKHPAVVGAALLEVTAKWVWGHQVPGDAHKTRKAREDALKIHHRGMWQMIALFDRIITVQTSARQ